jgi:hypothetical protein
MQPSCQTAAKTSTPSPGSDPPLASAYLITWVTASKLGLAAQVRSPAISHASRPNHPEAGLRRWSSVWRFYQGAANSRRLLTPWPIPRPCDWRMRVNRAETRAEREALFLSELHGF